MSERTTRKDLENKLDAVNEYLVKAGQPELDLDFNSIYGGYQLNYVLSNNHLTERMPAREMKQYLDGMHMALWMRKDT